MNDILNVYVANLGKYNEGELVGDWISLPVEEEELDKFLAEKVGLELDPQKAFEKGLRGEPVYEEYAIHDYESDFFKVDEYEDLHKLNERAAALASMNAYGLKCYEAAFEVFGSEVEEFDIDDIVLIEDVHSNYDLGYYWAVDSGCYDIDDKSPLARYFDYESFGRDIDFETCGGFCSYGYVEYRG